jgi:MFS family permease
VANAFDAPARQTLASELVDREDLTNAIALNSTMFNAAVAVGPAVGGLTYAFLGPGWCFTLNGLSFIAVIVGLFLMRTRPQAQPQRPKSTRSDLVEGLRYVLSEPMIRMLIGLIGVTSLFGISFATLMPAWAVSILGGDATTNGYLQSARGLGALIGALAIASLGRFTFKGKLLTIGSFAYPLLLLAFAFVHWLPLSLLVLVGAGAGLILVMNLANTLVQTLAPDELRGRVMGVYSLIFFGFMPVGGLLMGALAQRVGAPTTVILGASVALAFAILLWVLAPKLRAVE